MNHLFQPDGLPAYEQRRRHHIAWMREWALGRLMPAADTSPLPGDSEFPPRQGARIVPFRPSSILETPEFDSTPSDLEAGRIRLLAPQVSGLTRRPLYLLILGEIDDGQFWFAPFSPYSAPATNWELATGLGAAPLQSIQIWNTRSAAAPLLKQGWTAATAPRRLVEEAKNLHRSFIGGSKLPADLAERTGTRILATPDPRTEYIETETAHLDALAERSAEMRKHPGKSVPRKTDSKTPEPTPIPPLKIPLAESGLALAAADGMAERPLEIHTLLAGDTGARIHLLEIESRKNALVLVVENDPKSKLDGARILDAEGQEIATIRNGHAGSEEKPLLIVRHGFIEFSILLADGSPLELVPADDRTS